MKIAPFKALKAVRYAPWVENWPEIGRAAWSRHQLVRLRLRSGIAIDAVPATGLLGLYKEIWWRDEYRLRSDPLPRGATVVDIGANIGMFALCAATVGGAGRVFCFEPFPQSFELLQRNIEQNRLERVRAFRLGVAGQPGTRQLYVDDSHGCNKLFGTPGSQSVSIECITLEQVLERCVLDRCDLLKMDCEGAEFEILLGAAPALLQRFGRIALEYHDHLTEHTHGEIIERLRAIGFTGEAQRLGPRSGYIFAKRS